MVWALIVVPFVAALLIGYAIGRSALGQEAAWRSLVATTSLLLLALALGSALFFLPEPWQDYAFSGLFIICSIIPWITMFTWPQRKRQAGYLLWSLGRPSTHRFMLVVSTIFAISAIVQTTLFVNLANKGFSGSDNSPEYYISQVIFYWSIAIYFFWAGSSRLELRENGIYFKFGLIEWKQIASYKWEGAKGKTLTVWLKQRFPFFPTRSWPIPLVHKATIERLLGQYLSSGIQSTKNFK
jgi:hypothetical protein